MNGRITGSSHNLILDSLPRAFIINTLVGGGGAGKFGGGVKKVLMLQKGGSEKFLTSKKGGLKKVSNPKEGGSKKFEHSDFQNFPGASPRTPFWSSNVLYTQFFY